LPNKAPEGQDRSVGQSSALSVAVLALDPSGYMIVGQVSKEGGNGQWAPRSYLGLVHAEAVKANTSHITVEHER
jgi:hypothetical protein